MSNELNVPRLKFLVLYFFFLFCSFMRNRKFHIIFVVVFFRCCCCVYRGPFMVSRLREFLMDHGHEDLIGRLQRGKSIHSHITECFWFHLTNSTIVLWHLQVKSHCHELPNWWIHRWQIWADCLNESNGIVSDCSHLKKRKPRETN